MLTQEQEILLNMRANQMNAKLQADRQAVVAAMPSNAPTVPDNFSPLALAEGKRLGMTPSQYDTDMRLRYAGPGIRSVMGEGLRFNNATPGDLESDPRFRQALKARPTEAAKLFQVVTGQDYGKHLDARTAMSADRIKFQRETMQKKIASGEWKQEGSTFLSRKLVPNPTGTGEMILSDQYTPLDEGEQSFINPETTAGVIDPNILRRNELAARAASAPKVATLQPTATATPFAQTNEPAAPLGNALNAAYEGASNFFSNPAPVIGQAVRSSGLADLGSTITNMGIHGLNMLRPDIGLPYTSVGMDRGKDPRRVRAELQANPQFQEMLRKDPQRAMRLVAAMQNQ